VLESAATGLDLGASARAMEHVIETGAWLVNTRVLLQTCTCGIGTGRGGCIQSSAERYGQVMHVPYQLRIGSYYRSVDDDSVRKLSRRMHGAENVGSYRASTADAWVPFM
jgi:hypothetical protein